MPKGRGILAVPPLLPPQARRATFTDFAFISYPMVTEEAEPSLMQEPPHQAHPLALGAKGLESTVLNIFKDNLY